ncbi:MAG: hypothetical protein ACXWQO_19750 [Bdellovibrionota bacterium]
MKNFIYFAASMTIAFGSPFARAEKLDIDKYQRLGIIIAPLESATAEFQADLKLKKMEVPITAPYRPSTPGGIQVMRTTNQEMPALRIELPFDGSATKNANIEQLEKKLAEYEAKDKFCVEEEAKMHEEACGKSFFRASCERSYVYKPSAACQENFKQSIHAISEDLRILKEEREATFCYFVLPSKASEVELIAKGQKSELKAELGKDGDSNYLDDRNLTVSLKAKDGSVRQAVIVCDKKVSLRMLKDGFSNNGILINWSRKIDLKPNSSSIERVELLDSPNIAPLEMPAEQTAPETGAAAELH